MRQRVFAVVEFDTDEEMPLDHVATWFEAAIGREGGRVDATIYPTAEALADGEG